MGDPAGRIAARDEALRAALVAHYEPAGRVRARPRAGRAQAKELATRAGLWWAPCEHCGALTRGRDADGDAACRVGEGGCAG